MSPPPAPPKTPKPAWAAAFKRRREQEVGSQEELAIRADVSQSLISQIERGVQHPTGVSVERFARLLEALKWTPAAFVSDTGIPLGPNVMNAASDHPSLPADEVRPITDLHRVPVRGLAAAGSGFYSDDNILDYEYVTADEYRVGMLAVQIEGDSMEPTIPNGSRVYVDSRQTDPQDGKLFLIHIHGNGFIVKRARAVGQSWLLLSDNPKYPALTPDEATVVGQVYFVQPRGWRA